MNDISIRYRVTLRQFMAACEANWRARWQGTGTNLLAGSVGVVAGYWAPRCIRHPILDWLATAVMIAGILLILVTMLRYFIWRRAFRDTPKYMREIHVKFTDASIHVESAEGVSDLNWSYYREYLETPESFLLFIAKHTFSVIPKSAFEDAPMQERFRVLLQSRLPSLKKPSRGASRSPQADP